MHSSCDENTDLRSRTFTRSDDLKLIELVGQFGKRWRSISQCIPGKTSRQCRERYNNYICPDSCIIVWTDEEDQLLLKKYEQFGPQWSIILTFFSNRNVNQIKSRCFKLISKQRQRAKKENVKKANSKENYYFHERISKQNEESFRNIPLIPDDLETSSQCSRMLNIENLTL